MNAIENGSRDQREIPGPETSAAETSTAQDAEAAEHAALWTASAGGFSVTVDAFAITPGEMAHLPDDLWFLSMVGAQAALRAVWASLLNIPPKAVYLTPGTDGLALDDRYHKCGIRGMTQGTWKVRMAKMANGVGHHAMIYTQMAEYGHDNEIFVLLAREGENEQQAHHRFLDRRVSMPMHPSWAEWLWNRGIGEEEIVPMECAGIRAWLCLPNPPKLEADVSMAIRRHIIGV